MAAKIGRSMKKREIFMVGAVAGIALYLKG